NRHFYPLTTTGRSEQTVLGIQMWGRAGTGTDPAQQHLTLLALP
ncbi:MAG: hypothetical protein ACI97N_001570, partial [Cognaticolwellia sp.]